MRFLFNKNLISHANLNSFLVCQHFSQLSSFLFQPCKSLKNNVSEIDLSE